MLKFLSLAALCEGGFFRTFLLTSAKAPLHTYLVSLLECVSPCLKTSRAIFFILPCVLLSPYAAAIFVLLVLPPNKASFKISKPSSCIQDRLRAARRAAERSPEYNFPISCSRSSMDASSFSRPEISLFLGFIKPQKSFARSLLVLDFCQPKAVCEQQQRFILPHLCHYNGGWAFLQTLSPLFL